MVRVECLCGFMCGSEESMFKHLDKMGVPHAIRIKGDETPWTGPVEQPYVRPKAGVNPGCSVECQVDAAANRGRRTDAGGLGVSGALASSMAEQAVPHDLSAVDLTHFDVARGASPMQRTVSKDTSTLGPPDEVLDSFLYLAGRKNVSDMDQLPFQMFTHVVFALNDAPLATPYACNSSFFVDVADTLDANIRPYFDVVCRYIDKCKQEAGASARVLIHCQHGQSRSGALCIAYVMHSLKVDLRQAFELVARARPCLKVNVAFIAQLQVYEKILFRREGPPSISLAEADETGWCKAYFALQDKDVRINLEGTPELKGVDFGI